MLGYLVHFTSHRLLGAAATRASRAWQTELPTVEWWSKAGIAVRIRQPEATRRIFLRLTERRESDFLVSALLEKD